MSDTMRPSASGKLFVLLLKVPTNLDQHSSPHCFFLFHPTLFTPGIAFDGLMIRPLTEHTIFESLSCNILRVRSGLKLFVLRSSSSSCHVGHTFTLELTCSRHQLFLFICHWTSIVQQFHGTTREVALSGRQSRSETIKFSRTASTDESTALSKRYFNTSAQFFSNEYPLYFGLETSTKSSKQ